MPCYDPGPTERDKRAAINLQLIIDLRALGADIPLPIGFNETDSVFHKEHLLNQSTQILCYFCQHKGNGYIYDGRHKVRRRLADWWDEHKEVDKKEGEGHD